MAIGKLVKATLPDIFRYCETVDHDELDRLMDPVYSQRTFKISFPFCREVEAIDPAKSRRYWTEVFLVRGRRIRVTSQWIEYHRDPFIAYVVSKGLATKDELLQREAAQGTLEPSAAGAVLDRPGRRTSPPPRISSRANARYRGNAIGNAQNLFVRNILSRLGTEGFSEKDWLATKDYFGQRCAYCGEESAELVIEHAIPINRERLGEHRLGNLVPACRKCNADKRDRDYREFLEGNTGAIARIEEYMESRNYVPLEDNEQMRMILNMAHAEVSALADRYITIINRLFTVGPTSATEE